MHQKYAKAYLTQDNKVQILTDGKHMFESLITDIMEAKEYINIEYFIVKNDNTGCRPPLHTYLLIPSTKWRMIRDAAL